MPPNGSNGIAHFRAQVPHAGPRVHDPGGLRVDQVSGRRRRPKGARVTARGGARERGEGAVADLRGDLANASLALAEQDERRVEPARADVARRGDAELRLEGPEDGAR